MGTPDTTILNACITPMSATNCNEEFIIVVTSRKDYRLRKEAFNFTPPIQETCQFISAELVF